MRPDPTRLGSRACEAFAVEPRSEPGHTRCTHRFAMTRAELETTARIKRDTLRGLLDEMTDHPPRPPRKQAFGQVAALLPPIERVRFPRSTTPPPLGRGSNSNMTAAEQKAAQTLADARAKLDSVDAQLPFPMVPAPVDLQLALTTEPSWDAPPAIQLAPDDCVLIHSLPPREVVTIEEPVVRPNIFALVGLFVAAFFVGLLGAYAVI
jgi:hypothetical protein